jgi:hypothetical protein
MGDLEIAVLVRDENMTEGNSTSNLSIFDLPVAPIPWSDPMFYLSIIILVASISSIVYNLWTKEDI